MNVLIIITALIIGCCLGIFMVALLSANDNDETETEEQIKFLETYRRNNNK